MRGAKTASSGTTLTYGYTGREPDATGLTFYRARYYHPGIGRFASRDPMGMVDAVSPYAYVSNNPINLIDPWGLKAQLSGTPRNPAYWGSRIMLADAGGWLSGAWNTTQQTLTDFSSGFFGSDPLTDSASTASQLGRGTHIGLDYGLIGFDVLNSIVSPTPDVGIIGAAGITSRTVAKEAAEGAAKSGSIWSSAGSKSSVENALGHWNKHKGEFPELQNAKQYAEQAKDFLNNPPQGTLTKLNSRGDTLRYDPSTNTFEC